MRFKEFYTEAKLNDLRGGVNPVRKQRAKNMWVKYNKLDKHGTLFFNVESVTTNGKKSWQTQVKPIQKPTAEMTMKEFRATYNEDIAVKCNCPDFKYRFGYRATQDGYIYGKKEMLPSDITNPAPSFPQGTLCKHLENTLKVLRPNLSAAWGHWKKLND